MKTVVFAALACLVGFVPRAAAQLVEDGASVRGFAGRVTGGGGIEA
jgi:hypothetical protein